MAEHTPRPWPPAAIPTPEQLGAWLGVCTDEERLQAARSFLAASEENRECFARNHVGEIERLQHGMDCAIEDLRAIAEALGIGGHARPYSAHQVVVDEILPRIASLRG